MKAIFNSKGNLLARVSFALVALAGCLTSAFAESKLHIDDFAIQPGQEMEIAVNFDNGDGIAAVNAEFTLPEGLQYVSFRNNEARIERGVHTAYVDKQTSGAYRLTVLPSLRETIPGESGALVYLKVKADDSFSSGKMVFSRINMSDLEAELFLQDSFEVSVSRNVGHIAVNENSFSIKQDGKHKVEFFLNNTVDVFGLSGRITLPAGLSIEKNASGRYVFTYGGRLPQDAVVSYNENTGKFAVTAMSVESFGFEGMLFSFNVVASPELAQTSEIKFSEIEVADKNDATLGINDVVTIAVTNSYKADYEPAMTVAGELQALLDAANKTIADECADVKGCEALVSAAASIQSQIDNMKTAIQEAYDNETLAATKDEVLAPKTAIEAAVAKLIEDAKAAQTAYEEEQAKIAANEAANTRLTEEIAALQTKLDAAKETVSADCKDVAADFAEAEAAIQSSIDALVADIKTKYEAVELTAESSIAEEAAAIEAAIEKLIEDAKEAQKDFEIASGINAVSGVADSDAEYYTLSGERVQTPAKGQVYIVKIAGGKVKKVYVK